MALSNVQSTESVENTKEKRIKPLKIGHFRDFCHFRCQFEVFSYKKQLLSAKKILLDNELVPYGAFSTV